MNRPAIAVLALLGLLLTGCAASPADATAPAETPARLVATTTPTPDVTLSAEDAEYVSTVRRVLFGTGNPASIAENVTDESLIAAGRDACAQMRDGVTYPDVTVIEGEQRGLDGLYPDSAKIAMRAANVYCPEQADAALESITTRG